MPLLNIPIPGKLRPQRLNWIAAFVLVALLAGLLFDHPICQGAQAGAAQTSVTEKQPIESHLSEKVQDFELRDFRGKSYRLSDFAEQQVIVLIFSGTECPLAKLYWPTLNELQQEYAQQGVTFLAINSNAQDSVTDIAASVRRSEIAFPVLKDVGNLVADQLHATRTPEAFVLDRDRIVRYQGRIDDHFDVGIVRSQTQHRYLRDAIQAVLAQKAVEVPRTDVVGCLIGRLRRTTDSQEVTFTNQISRILNRRCVECHRPQEIAPFTLMDYEEVAGWSEMILEVIEDRRMPPWHASPEHGTFSNQRGLTDEEHQLIKTWVQNGCPEGDPNDLPEQPKFASKSWQLEREPDEVYSISSTPVVIPADGEVAYQYFEVDPGFTSERWIKAAELKPGNHAVVHHILAFAVPPGETVESMGSGARGYLVGYVPGLRVEPLLPGMAKRVPAGSRLVFQMHYTPIGTRQEDISKLGLIFADPSEVTHEVVSMSALETDLKIPPGDDDYPVFATTKPPFRRDFLLLSMMPHMHLRGKSFRYELRVPDQPAETLLDIPAYDFNWQTSYQLAEPRRLPEHSRIHCVARYDNSEDNPYNPDPERFVPWGDQTTDEMMIGYFDVAIPIDVANEMYQERQARIQQQVAKPALDYLQKHDTNGDGFLQIEELPARVRRRFDQFDTNGDKRIDLDELKPAFARR